MFVKTTLNDHQDSYPRLCSHRGISAVMPENTLPAFAAAIALGSQEIELDLWPTADGEIVVCHDSTVDRVTDGHGSLVDLTYAEIQKLDAGGKFSAQWKGVQIPLFDDVLKNFARKVVINIHIKSLNTAHAGPPKIDPAVMALMRNYRNNPPIIINNEKKVPPIGQLHGLSPLELAQEYNPATLKKIVDIIDRYDCREYVYFTGEQDLLASALKVAPDITRCCLEGHTDYTIVEKAIKYKCKKLQFHKLFLTIDMIKKAHDNNLICNIFWSDHREEAKSYLDLGIHTILTNDYLAVKDVL